MCLQAGTDATMDVFGMLGRETGLKEFNVLMKMCIEQCRETDDENVAKEQISQVLELFISMKEQGFPIEEETYGPFLMLLIDKESMMKRRFRNFAVVFVLIMGTRISVYELLETVDITKLSSLDNAVSVFKSLGRLSLESYVEKFLLVLKNCDYGTEDISTLIFSYATSIPNLAAEDVISKFKTLHTVMEMSPSSTSYERLIVYSCNALKVHHAIDMVDQLCEEVFTYP
ncbi:PREDICTED: pentatricopeptide repeat-containing protein At4g21880, mitochondrial-like isoform X7 [Populus euphratica]|uniref:Pentatricopeptide repeat-containing protein At4g21880, mitochondrial-like isoform X7 n=1 Tax=Populus euphratica TaxID=75702 RepID=A0AAJ6XU28_POPEU|nr:PREDICTED: pentatricopeptide repeat-containing protein At4g21880, mitochondrial-like isoform X7 [Populus euphratica]